MGSIYYIVTFFATALVAVYFYGRSAAKASAAKKRLRSVNDANEIRTGNQRDSDGDIFKRLRKRWVRDD